MQLLELTREEQIFLATPQSRDAFQARLTQRLALTLTARLHTPVSARDVDALAGSEPPTAPRWQPDSALSTIWLTCRLGGQRVSGTAPFVPRDLLHTLDALLAESWLDAASAAYSTGLAWQLQIRQHSAALQLALPAEASVMTLWAREVLRHG